MTFSTYVPIIQYKIFTILRYLYMIIDQLLDILIGYSLVSGWNSDRKLAKARFDKSGNLTRILSRGSEKSVGNVELEYYILKHEKYINAEEFILNNDHVTFMALDEHQVWFSVGGCQASDVYDLTIFPFAFMSQYYTSEKILIIDHSTFHKIAEKSGGPIENCILINNTGRCGSTLLNQMFSKLPQTVSMSEPWGLFFLHILYRKDKITEDAYLKLLESCVKIQFKPCLQKEIKRYVLKLPFFASALMPDIHKIFGDKIKIMFSTRLPKPSIISFTRVVIGLAGITNKTVLADFWLAQIGLPHDEKSNELYKKVLVQGKTMSYAEMNAAAHAAVMKGFISSKQIYSHVKVFEEAMQDVNLSTTKLFQDLDVPTEFVPLALTALNKNSQNDLFESMSSDGLISEQDWIKVDQIFQTFEIPMRVDMTLDQLISLVN